MNCPDCHKYFEKRDPAAEHVEKYHSDSLRKMGMDAYQYLYYSTHGTIKGKCMCGCGKDTEWNYKTGKPYKVSPDPACRQRLRDKAVKNHIGKYGEPTLLNDMEHQRKMQENRPTAGKYKFSDGGVVDYLSKLELNFLQFCDRIVDMESQMIQRSPEIFTYWDEKAQRERQYDPDYYLPDYNLIVEIKDGGSHTNTNPAFEEETKYKVALKDAAMRKQKKYNYIKIVDAQYGQFMEMLYQITHKQLNIETVKKSGNQFFVITENATVDLEDEVVFDTNVEKMSDSLYVLVSRTIDGNFLTAVAVCENDRFDRIYLTDYMKGILHETDKDDTAFGRCTVDVYRYIGDKKILQDFWKVVINLADPSEAHSLFDLMMIMKSFGMNFTAGTLRNCENRQMDFVKVDASLKLGGD